MFYHFRLIAFDRPLGWLALLSRTVWIIWFCTKRLSPSRRIGAVVANVYKMFRTMMQLVAKHRLFWSAFAHCVCRFALTPLKSILHFPYRFIVKRKSLLLIFFTRRIWSVLLVDRQNVWLTLIDQLRFKRCVHHPTKLLLSRWPLAALAHFYRCFRCYTLPLLVRSGLVDGESKQMTEAVTKKTLTVVPVRCQPFFKHRSFT